MCNLNKNSHFLVGSDKDENSCPSYRPSMEISAADAAPFAEACAVLGGGGGGDPQPALDVVIAALQETGPAAVVSATKLDPDGMILPWLYVGAPTVLEEKLWSGREAGALVAELEAMSGKAVVGIMTVEIGGQNGVLPLAWASALNLPLVDADGMGRAFPLITQTKMNVLGVAAGPVVVTDEHLNVIVIRPISNDMAEVLVRASAATMGGRIATAPYPMSARDAVTYSIEGSVSRAFRLGQALAKAPGREVRTLEEQLGAELLGTGRVIDLERHFEDAAARGSATILLDEDRMLRVEFRDEYIVALLDGQLLAVTPDVIAVLDIQSGRAVTTEQLCFGQKLAVLAFPCDPVWRSVRGLELVGPRAFGLSLDYHPVEELSARG